MVVLQRKSFPSVPTMEKPRISIICAVAKDNNAIGKDNKLLWNIPEDLKRFKKITSGHPIIMGLNTYNSIGRPLPDRMNVVLSQENIEIEGCTVVNSLEEAIEYAGKIDQEEIFIIGGGMVYRESIKLANRLYLTLVEGKYEADTFFPDFKEFNKVIEESKLQKTNNYAYKYVTLEK